MIFVSLIERPLLVKRELRVAVRFVGQAGSGAESLLLCGFKPWYIFLGMQPVYRDRR